MAEAARRRLPKAGRLRRERTRLLLLLRLLLAGSAQVERAAVLLRPRAEAVAP